MESTLFSQHDFLPIAIILAMPLLGAFINGVWGKRLGNGAVRLMALSAVGASFLASLYTFSVLRQAAAPEHVEAVGHAVERAHAEHVRLVWTAWEWMHTTGGTGALNIPIELSFSVDQLSGVMMLVITGIGFLIHLYATSYMEKDPGFARFFAYLNLFIFSMLVLVLGDNLPVLFVGWEGVGLCSYLLIGFWYEGEANAKAGKKAFITNRIGDFGLICAMFLLAHYTGALDWRGIEAGSSGLMRADVTLFPLGGGEYSGFLQFLNAHKLVVTGATAVGMSLLLGATGKSAQLPLYVWLPDAMAGPTPVSALIHAATMVTAGIYLICRLSFVFVMSPFVMMMVAIVGASTALFAATIALVQNDIKKVLAYSTVSQLGFMFLGVGVGAFSAGFFHVLTHAFFKACLFLGAGSVIHSMHGRIHDDVASQDIRNMGGLRKFMPTTFWTFTAATLAIIGLPLTSGFFSKDEILFRAFVNEFVPPAGVNPTLLFKIPEWIGPMLWVMGVLAAMMTAFYMCRVYILTFFGEFRGWTVGHAHHEPAASHHDAHHHEDLAVPGAAPHESPWQMTTPLVILGALSLFGGVLNLGFHLPGAAMLEHWLEPVFEVASKSFRAREYWEKAGLAGEIKLALPGGVLAFAVGTSVAYWMYVVTAGAPAKALASSVPGLHRLLLDKWRIDELYEATILGLVDALADMSAAFDRIVVDGIIARLTSLFVAGAGTLLRASQNGVIHAYGAMMVLGLGGLGWFFVAPHAATTTAVDVSGKDYTVTAAPGMGYSYAWDTKGQGKPDSPASQQQVKVNVPAGTSKTIKLEVTNAFGFHTSTEVILPPPGSQPSSSNQAKH